MLRDRKDVCATVIDFCPIRAVTPELLKQLRSARLMLYAWKGSRPKEYGAHPELNNCITDIESALTEAEGLCGCAECLGIPF
jgi:hypothetical protein